MTRLSRKFYINVQLDKLKVSWLEILILLGVIASLIRSIYFINIGFDPHHDFYALAPGLFASEGLIPHKEFYTHYGAFEAIIKSFLLSIFGKSLSSLRTSLLILNFTGLIGICYLCELKRNKRLPLLILILIWFTFDPTSAAAQATSKGHFPGWSSDVAFFLICVFFIFLYWYNRIIGAYLLVILRTNKNLDIKSSPRSYSTKTDGLISFDKLEVAHQTLYLKYFLGISIGFILGCIFFTKFTIGLSMISGLILNQGMLCSILLTHDKKPTNRKLNWRISFSEYFALLFFKRYTLGVILPIIAGFILCIALQLNLIGGVSEIPNYINDTFTSQFKIFQGGRSFGILRPLRPVFTDYTLLGLLIAILIFEKLKPKTSISLLFASLFLTIIGNKLDVLGFAQGNLETSNYTKAFGYIIAVIIVFGSIKLALKRDSVFTSSSAISYLCTAIPIGLFSLTQFYPVTDPFHVWWAIGTSLPAATYLILETGNNRSISVLTILSPVFIVTSIIFTVSSFIITFKMIKSTSFESVLDKKSTNVFLKDIRSADVKSSNIMQAAYNLNRIDPRSIILEAGYGTFLDLMNSPEARKAYSKCKIIPLLYIDAYGYTDRLSCLKTLKKKGWSVYITNYGSSSKERTIDNKLIATYAILDYSEEPKIVKESKVGTFTRRNFGNFIYWDLN